MVWGGENERTIVMPGSILTSVGTTLVGKFCVTNAVISVRKSQLFSFSTPITTLGSGGGGGGGGGNCKIWRNKI